MADPKGPIISSVLKGFSVTLCSIGKSGSGKTNSFFGIDSPYNDTQAGFHLLNSFYRKLKASLKPGEETLYVFSLSIGEIGYDEERGKEIFKDLLDVSDSISVESFSKGFISVIFKTEDELEEIIYFSRLRSENWRSNFNQDENIQDFKFLNNKSHQIMTLNIMNMRTKKVSSICVFDLIGFQANSKKELKQISLNQLMSFFNEIITNKDNISKLKKSPKQSGVTTAMALTPKRMNFVSFFSNFFLNTNVFFFVPANTQADYYQDSHSLLEKLFELSNISYPIEKRQVINCSQFLNFPSFIKSTEIFINNYAEDVEQPENEPIQYEREPLEEYADDKNGKAIGENSIGEKMSQELKNIYQKMETLNAKMNFSEIEEASEENERSRSNSAKLDTKKSSPTTPLREEKLERLQVSSEKVRSPEPLKDLKEEAISIGSKESPLHAAQNSIYEIYDRKVKNILGTLMNYEFPTNSTNKGDLYIMKRNYELLLNLFQEGEEIRKNLMLQFVELKDNLLEFKAEFDLKLNDEKLKNIELQRKIRLVSSESDSRMLIESYENEIQRLNEEKQYLLKENDRILREMSEEVAEEKEQPAAIMNVRNALMRNVKNLQGRLAEKEKELSEYRRRERSFLSSQNVLKSVTNKNQAILKTLTEKENQEKQVVEICARLEKENAELKENLLETQKNFKALSDEYFKNKEQMFLFKEMAKAPEGFFVGQVKKQEKSLQIQPGPGGSNSKKISKESREKLFESLKSLGD